MGLKEDFASLVSSFDKATNEIAARIDALKAQIPAAGGLSADDAAAIRDQLSAEVARLQGLGADPANPVPGA